MKKIFLTLMVFFLCVSCSQQNTEDLTVQSNNEENKEEEKVNLKKLDSANPPYKVEEIASGLEVPWSLVFTDNDRILVTERLGNIRIIANKKLIQNPILTIDEVASQDEDGLMDMELDRDYSKNKYLYVCYTYKSGSGVKDKVVRLTDNGETLDEPFTIIDNIPAAKYHSGCELGFGPDGKLYISTGEATVKNLAQDLNSLGGKILRINSDGSIPDDNPFENSFVYSFGHRNSQGFDWDLNGNLFATEHGPSTFDGPPGGDEINLIKAGQNYGWPIVSHEKSKEGMIDPLLVFTPAIAPSSAVFVNSDKFPEFENNLLLAMLKGEGIMRIVFDENSQVLFYEKLPSIDVGRVREIIVGPDGYIYFTTSNRDARGDLNDGDDRVYRLINSN